MLQTVVLPAIKHIAQREPLSYLNPPNPNTSSMDEAGLPTTDPEMVHQMQMEYDEAFRKGSEEDLEGARFRLVWAMVHCIDQRHVSRGTELAKRRLSVGQILDKDKKELLYLAAVGCYKSGKYVEARRLLKQVLLENPDFRQAEQLQSSVDDKILKEGLVGVGIGAAVLGVGLAVLFGGRR